MKIGILTYHRAENYGALLQAYALRTYLQELGHEVSFVDYWPDYHMDYFKVFSWDRFKHSSWKRKIKYFTEALLWFFPKMTRRDRLQRFIHEELGMARDPLYNENTKKTEHFDVVVYGSDQIWRKQNMGGVGFDDWYFGANYVHADKKIVYAGSMGTVKTTVTDDEYFWRMMQNFQAISVREVDLQSYLQKLHIPSTLVIDPVFLLGKEQWQQLAVPKSDKEGKYILFYNLLNKAESVRFAEMLSKETGLHIKEINKKLSFRHLGRRYTSTASVGSFLQMIRDADYVVSNSFHGVALSLLFQKQFFAVGMNDRANRVKSLLNSIGLSYRYVDDSSISPLSVKGINYSEVQGRLASLVNSSKEFLRASV